MTTQSAPSILNDVLGPVMRGPSSSHTAGSCHIGALAAALLQGRACRARLTFDPAGSYAQVYRQQGSDRAFVAGLLGWALVDARVPDALRLAPECGLDVEFAVAPLAGADHPNTVDLELTSSSGDTVRVRARSVGGGAVEVTRVGDWAVQLTGRTPAVLVETDAGARPTVQERIERETGATVRWCADAGGATWLGVALPPDPLTDAQREALRHTSGVVRVREAPPIGFVRRGRALFASADEMIQAAEARGWSLGRTAVAYEAGLLQRSDAEVMEEMGGRLAVMRAAVHEGLRGSGARLQLLRPTAWRVMEADAAGRLAVGGLHARAAARAMAVMHVNSAMGVVCAAPTGGSAGVIPGVIVSLVEERALPLEDAVRALFAASAIGVIVARRATFAAEVAGCQVEIGAASAMAAAAVVDAAGGGAAQAAAAAAIAFQNTMGSVCDLVQGMVEIPCHTRNAVGASSAFVCADLVLGGYENPIPLDETIDAVLDVGRMLPAELRCTARGGLALTRSARTLAAFRLPE